MKRFLILALTVIMLFSALCVPSFAVVHELPFVPCDDYMLPEMPICGHTWENGVCTACGEHCVHSSLSEYICTTCGETFLEPSVSTNTASSDNELSFGGFIALFGGAAAIFVIIYAVSALKAKKSLKNKSNRFENAHSRKGKKKK